MNAPASSLDTRPTCRCGHTKDHPLVTAEPKYSLFHFCMGLFMGSSLGDPKSVRFQCSRCGDVIEESTDPELRATHGWT